MEYRACIRWWWYTYIYIHRFTHTHAHHSPASLAVYVRLVVSIGIFSHKVLYHVRCILFWRISTHTLYPLLMLWCCCCFLINVILLVECNLLRYACMSAHCTCIALCLCFASILLWARCVDINMNAIKLASSYITTIHNGEWQTWNSNYQVHSGSVYMAPLWAIQ